MAEQQPIRLMNFVSESKLEELKATRGAKVEDGTLAPDRPLHEILRENKEKQDKEFKDRFKHRPPKALDDEEMEFLEKLEMVKREHERQVADEEAQALSYFHDAIANKTITFPEPQSSVQPKKDVLEPRPKRPSQSRTLASFIKVKPRPEKKAKVEDTKVTTGSSSQIGSKQQDAAPQGLVAYDDESDEE